MTQHQAKSGTKKLLMVDNYDSFTYNLVQYFGELGAEVETRRNDQITVSEVQAMTLDGVVLSPGPCTPNEAGICLALITALAGQVPILGVCLGHQAIGQAFGGQVVRAKQVMHGKTSPIHHSETGVFRQLSNPFEATRYHSLVVDRASLPDCLEETAWTLDEHGQRDEIMGFRHRQWDIEGVQFHPESILTQHGHDMLNNFLERL
jgi:anthranilate synthase component 2